MESMEIKMQQWEQSFNSLTAKEKAEQMVEKLNSMEGDLDKSIYDCPKCKNRGFIYSVKPYFNDFMETAKECDCKPIRNSIIRMRRSGLEPIIKKCTFERYETTEEWQKVLKEKALAFVNDIDLLDNKWFFVGGGIGSGKTHLCTAMVKELIENGKSARYMLWINDSTRLKAMINVPEYEAALDEFRKADVLYIDDFLKIVKDNQGKEMLPTGADIRLAYEIINYRYMHSELITIISSERFINEIESIDSAVGSRIIEKCGANAIGIARKQERNYRMKNLQVI